MALHARPPRKLLSTYIVSLGPVDLPLAPRTVLAEALRKAQHVAVALHGGERDVRVVLQVTGAPLRAGPSREEALPSEILGKCLRSIAYATWSRIT